MSDKLSPEELIDELADSFVERLRAGQHASISQYTAEHPELADQIREVFSALALIEDVNNPVPSHAGPTGSVAPGSLPFQQLHDYQIVREIGRGGMGIVYEAKQKSLGRRVAIKLLPGGAGADSKYHERFQREARAAARLKHPHIVPVYDMGQHEGSQYFAMEFIDGRGLGEVLHELQPSPHQDDAPADHPPPPSTDNQSSASRSKISTLVLGGSATHTDGSAPQPYYHNIARIIADAADGLDYAHEEGVLHRDIKPSNLLLDAEGKVWITDFGLAKDDTHEDGLTQTGDLLGTLRYMPPERFDGWSDARSDVYSLGLTLYECLTLKPAFSERDRAKLIRQITTDEPPAPSTMDRTVPHDLETITLKAIARDPGQRYRTMGELRDDLQRFLNGEPIRARRTSVGEQINLWCRRNPLVATLAGSVVALMLIVTVISMTAAVQLSKLLTRTTVAEREAIQRLFDVYVSTAETQSRSGSIGQRFSSLEAAASAAELIPNVEPRPDQILQLRNLVAGSLRLVDLRIDREWPRDREARGIEFDAAGDVYAGFESVDDEFGCRILIRQIADNVLLTQVDANGFNPEHPPTLRFSPDGNYLAAKGRQSDAAGLTLSVWEIRSGKRIYEGAVGGTPQDRAVDFSLDCRSVFVVDEDNDIQRVSLTSGKTVRFETGMRPYCLRCSPDGKWLAAVGSSRLQLIDLKTGELQRSRYDHAMRILDLAWSSDSRYVATACHDRSVYICDTSSASVAAKFSGHQSPVQRVAFSHDGDILASSDTDGVVRIREVATGRQLLEATGQIVSFSRDDTRLAWVTSDRLGQWEVARGHEMRRIDAHGERNFVFGLSFSSDSRILATAAEDGVKLWDARSGKQLASLPELHANSVHVDSRNRFVITAGLGGANKWLLEKRDGHFNVSGPVALTDSQTQDSDLSTDGGHLVIVETGNTAVVVKTDELDGESIKLNCRDGLHSARISSDGQRVATCSWQSPIVQLWNAESGELLNEIPAGQWAQIVFDPGGTQLVLGDAHQTVIVETDTGRVSQRLPAPSSGNSGRLALSTDGLLALHSTPGSTQLLDAKTGLACVTLPTDRDSDIESYCFSPRGDTFAIGTNDGRVYVWHLDALYEQLARTGLHWNDSQPIRRDLASGSEPLSITLELRRPATAGILHDDPETLRANEQMIVESTQGIAKQPGYFWNYVRRGEALKQLGRAREARADFRRAVELAQSKIDEDPGNVGAVYNRGYALKRLGDYEHAILDLTRIIEESGPKATSLAERAECYRRVGQFELARQDYTRVIGLMAPAKSGLVQAAFFQRAVLTLQSTAVETDYRSILDDLNQALQTSPEAGGAGYQRAIHNNLAWVYAIAPTEFWDADKALKHARRACELWKDSWVPLSGLGLVHLRRREYTEAINALQQSIGADTKRTTSSLPLADSQPVKRKTAERVMENRSPREKLSQQIKELDAAIAQNPEDPRPVYNRAALYVKLGKKREARADYLKAIELFVPLTSDTENALDAFHLTAHAHSYLEQYDESVAACSEAIRLNPRSAHLLEMRGFGYRKLKLLPRAATDFTRAIELSDKSQSAYYWRGIYYLSLERFAEAAADFKSSLDLKPMDCWPCDNLAWIYAVGPVDLRDPTQSLKYAQLANRINPNSERQETTLALAHYRNGFYNKALAILDAREEPLYVTRQLLYCLCYWHLDQPRQAEQSYQRAVENWKTRGGLSPTWEYRVNILHTEAAALFTQ